MVVEVLRVKHLEARPVMDASFNRYMGAPTITADKVTYVGCQLYVGAGTGGAESVSLRRCII